VGVCSNELATQTAGVTVDGACGRTRLVSPDQAQQLLLAEYTVRGAGKLNEQLVLQPAQVEALADSLAKVPSLVVKA